MTQFTLLSKGNPKTLKGEAQGYMTFILHLAPASLSGFNVCPMATQGCIASCLNTAGRGGIFKPGETSNTIQAARIRKTKLFFADRAGFMSALVADIAKAIRHAEKRGFVPVFRLNGTSDIRWETIPASVADAEGYGFTVYPNVMKAFPTIQFYDYTKIANRKGVPANYSLTFSLADGNEAQAIAALRNGHNVAAVFRDEATVARYVADGVTIYAGTAREYRPAFNGDESDLRFRDPSGVVVALYAKGKARKDQSGFVRD